MGIWQQFCDHVVPTCCNFEVSFLCIFFVFYCSHFGIWHFELWGFQGWQNVPLMKSPLQNCRQAKYPTFTLCSFKVLHIPPPPPRLV